MRNLNKESQIRILNTLLQRDLGEKYIKYFNILDNSIVNRAFSFIGSSMLLHLIVEFYEKYKHIPEPPDFYQYCIDNAVYTDFMSNTHPDELEQFRAFEAKLFEPVVETDYLTKMIRDFIVHCYGNYITFQKLDALKEAEKSGDMGVVFEVHKEYNEKEHLFLLELEADLGQGAKIEFKDIIYEDVDITTLSDSTAIHVFGTLHMYQHNIAVLMSPAKFWKTGATILTGLATSDLKYETAFLDLENGYDRILRRVYQNFTKTTKNEVKFNLYLDRNILHNKYGLVLHNPYLNTYEEGQVTYDLEAIKDEEGNEHPRLIFKRFDGMSADGSSGLWTTLEGYEDLSLRDVSSPLQPVIDKAKQERRDKDVGGFHLAHAKGIKPKDIKRALIKLGKENERWERAGKNNKRVLIIDWMLLLDSDEKRDSVWLKSNDIYASLQKMAEEFNLYIIAIEGVANPEMLKVWDVDLANIKPKFNKGIDYNAAHVSVFCACEAEKPTTRRMYAKEDRDGSSGTKDDCAYFLISPQLMQAKQITREEHQEMYPNLWGLASEEGDSDAESIIFDSDGEYSSPKISLDIPNSF